MMANHVLQKIKDKYVSQCGASVGTICPSVIENGREKKIIHMWFQTQ
jgi:hypothetical protein